MGLGLGFGLRLGLGSGSGRGSDLEPGQRWCWEATHLGERHLADVAVPAKAANRQDYG